MFGWLLKRLVKSFGATGAIQVPNEGRIVGDARARSQSSAARGRRQIIGSPARRQVVNPRGPR